MSNGETVPTVLLDSVQSQANRMEQALLDAHRAEKLKLPLLQVDFTKDFPDIGFITTLDAPHRIADAIFRDSLLDRRKFRESDIGQAFENANIRNATALFQYCPHALVFGVWDSTGSKGGLGNKFQRVVNSEIIGVQAERGVHTSSRIDPLGITTAAELYEAKNGDWT
jgi:CRISPR-associated protein Csb1